MLRTTLVFFILSLLGCIGAASAQADYTVVACNNDDGTGTNHAWTSTTASTDCVANSGLLGGTSGTFTVWNAHGWNFVAPEDTALVSFSYKLRVAWAGTGTAQADNPPAAPRCSQIDSDAPNFTAEGGPGCFFGASDNGSVWPATDPSLITSNGQLDGTRLRIVSYCGWASCYGWKSYILTGARQIQVRLNDPSDPALLDTPTGGLLAGKQELRGTQSGTFNGGDAGSGIASWRVRVDDATVSEGNTPCDYSYKTPCPTTYTASTSWDTSAVDDGTHTVEYSVANASGGRTVATHDIITENHAPTILFAPTISGQAKVGKTLMTTDGTWKNSNDTAVATYQWQRCQSGNCNNIVGETSSSYDVDEGDAGYSFRVSVTETDVSGSGSAWSEQTVVVPSTTGTHVTDECRTLTFKKKSVNAKLGSTKVQIHFTGAETLTGTDQIRFGLKASRTKKIRSWQIRNGKDSLATAKVTKRSSSITFTAGGLPTEASSLTAVIKPIHGAVKKVTLPIVVGPCI